MSDERDRDVVRRGYAAWARKDFEELLSLMDPEIEWHPPPTFPEPGPHQGTAPVRRALRSYEETFDLFVTEPERLLATDRPGEVLALARTRIRGKGSGAEVTIDVAHLFTVRDGAIARFEVIMDRREALRRVGLDPAIADEA